MSTPPKTGPAIGRVPSPVDYKALWAEVQQNHKTLESCDGPHDFKTIDPGKAFGKHRCTKCGGETTGSNVYWYKAGLAHGKLRKQRPG